MDYCSSIKFNPTIKIQRKKKHYDCNYDYKTDFSFILAQQDAEFGDFFLQQNVGGHPVAVYRFAPRVRFPAGSTVTVWAACNDAQVHKPPTDYYFKDLLKWGTGPECTTILCRPDGQVGNGVKPAVKTTSI